MQQTGVKTASTLGPPPQLPSIKDLDPELASYLRKLALWAQGGFNASVQKASATGELYIAGPTTVWRITVDDSGALHTTQMTPGGGP